MHHPPAQINVLLRALPAPPPRRRVFWAMATACRRRLARRWELTPRARGSLRSRSVGEGAAAVAAARGRRRRRRR